MPRRSREEGPSLESDSFLDIVANIVGILIILIVIAGVRVGQSAAAARKAQLAELTVEPARAPVVAPRPIVVHQPAADAPAPAPDPALIAAIEDSEHEREAAFLERTRLEREAVRLEQAAAARAEFLNDRAAEQTLISERLAQAEVKSSDIAAELSRLRSTLEGLSIQIADTPAEKVAAVRHRLNPIGREVSGEELHFRVAEGKVVQVPIDELIERLKTEIGRQKDWIARYRRHQGTVGPVGGFTMDYVVERQRLSVVEELRQGVQMMRIVVSGWRVQPGRDLEAEPVEEAIRGDSRFLSALRLAGAETTVTFWVYPDSFDAYRRLQEATHELGLDVAARPLPDGVPIAGSPSGSRSTSQ